MSDQNENRKDAFNDRDATEKLWHLKRGFEVAFFIVFLVLVFGLIFHRTRHDVYLDTFLGSRAAEGGVGALRQVTAPGAVITGWLWWVLAYGISWLGGPWLVSFFAGLLMTAGFAVLLAALRRSVNVVIAGALLVAAAYVSRPYYFPGGQAAGVFLFAVLAALLVSSTDGVGRRIWFVPAIMALWVNLDLSWVAGAALCVAFLPFFVLSPVKRRAYAIIALLAALAATLLNPDFSRAWDAIWQLPLSGEAAPTAPIGAHVPIGLAFVIAGAVVGLPMAGFARHAASAGLLAVAAVLIAVGGGLCTGVFPLLALAVFASLAIALPGVIARFAALASAPVPKTVLQWLVSLVQRTPDGDAPPESADWALRRKHYAACTLIAGAGVLALAVLFCYGAVGSRYYRFGGGVDAQRLPSRAADFITARGLSGTLLTQPSWAGYVLARTFPAVTVLCDMRPLSLDPSKVRVTAQAFGAPMEAGDSIAGVLERAGVSLALVPLNWPKAADAADRWVPIYWDDLSAVFVPRTLDNAAIIAALDQSRTFPAYFGYGLTAEQAPAMIAALAERFRDESPSAHVCYELGVCYVLLEQKETAANYLILALRVNPTLATAYHVLGDIVRGGNVTARDLVIRSFSADVDLAVLLAPLRAARQEDSLDALAIILYSQAVRFNRNAAMSYLRLGELYLKRGAAQQGMECLFQARNADQRHPQLDAVKPGLRGELDEQIARTMPKPRRPPQTAPAPPLGAETSATASDLGPAPAL